MKKKILSTLSAVLTFVMLLGAFAVIPVGAEEQSASKPTVETEFGWNGYTARAPKGKGTIDEPYEISSPENLLWMKNLSSNGAQHFRTFGENHEVWIPTYAEEDNLDTESAKTVDYTSFESAPQVYFKQTCDIDLNGKTLTSIASYWIATGATNGTKYAKGQWFGGHYDGQGYAIKNGYIKGSGTNANWNGGLFGAVWGATIENMVFDNVHSYGSEDVSMVVGKVLGPKDFDTTGATADIFNARETVIQNITVKDNCTIKQEGQSNETGLYAGGIVARANANATIRNCINKADITVDANVGFVGGILGVLGSNSTVDHCVNEGDIYFTGLWKTSADAEAQTGVFKGECAFGGIVGSWNYISGTDIFGDMAITNCINKGSFESAAVTGGTMMSYGGISGRTVALATANGATYTFKNNINMGADPCDNINTNVTGSSKNRAAALIGSAWNAETYEWAQLVATNCYSAPFTGIGTGYPLRPSDDNPLVCSADKKTPTIASRPCATADSTCETLGSVNEVLGLGLYVQINFEIDGFDHKFLAAQYKDQADGTYSVRLISGIDSVEYKKLSYDVVLTVDGKQASKSYVQYAVYTSVLADGYDGATTRNASEFGYEYLSLLTFNGLKADVTYSIGFTPKVVYLDGTMSEGKPVILNICNGEVTYEDPNATATGDIKIAGNDIGSYTITYDASNEPTYYVANAIKNYIAQATGKTLTLADVNSASGEYIINVGNAAEKGTYSVTQTGKRLDLLFSGAVAAEELVEQIKNLYMNNRDYNVDLCTVDGKLYVEQNHKVLGDIEAAAEVKAVFEKDSDSDIRIMYQNIHGLSMMSEAETQGYTGTKDELTQKVLELLQAAYVGYDPDIICLQEASRTTILSSQCDMDAVVNWLDNNGYDYYRGNNTSSLYVNQKGSAIPIFYKEDKFTLVASGTPWNNSNSDYGSDKGTNWVVLKDNNTGKQFAVFNSHFSANTNADSAEQGAYYRAQLANQLTSEVSSVVSTYGVDTVITGGDYNTQITQKATYTDGVEYRPYENLINGGLTNVRDALGAADKTQYAPSTSVKYNSEIGMYDLSSFSCSAASNAIDHVMYKFGATSTAVIKRYEVCNDRLSCTASDHLPHFVDFSWN